MEGVMKLVKDIIDISKQIYNLFQKLANIEKNDIEKNIVEYRKILEYIELCTELEDKYYSKLSDYNFNEINDCFNKIIKYSLIESKTKKYINDRFSRKLKKENINEYNNQNEFSEFFKSIINMFVDKDYDDEHQILCDITASLNIMFINEKIDITTSNDDLREKLIEYKYNCMYSSEINPIYAYEPVFPFEIHSMSLVNKVSNYILNLIDNILSKKFNEYELIVLLCTLKSFLYTLDEHDLKNIAQYYENNTKNKNMDSPLIKKIDECIEDLMQKRKKLNND